jgi:acyl-CoA synthetase (NDP forming)
MIASATPDQYAETLSLLLADDDVDALIVIFIPPLVTQATDVGHAISEALSHASNSKTVLACFMSTRGAPEGLARAKTVPSYISRKPQRALRRWLDTRMAQTPRQSPRSTAIWQPRGL